jgi:hypothetical protein
VEGVHHGTARLRGVGAVGRFARLRGGVRELDGGLFEPDVDESHEGVGVGRGQRWALFAHRVAHGLDGDEDALGFVGHQGDDDLDGAVAAGAEDDVAGVEGSAKPLCVRPTGLAFFCVDNRLPQALLKFLVPTSPGTLHETKVWLKVLA